MYLVDSRFLFIYVVWERQVQFIWPAGLYTVAKWYNDIFTSKFQIFIKKKIIM